MEPIKNQPSYSRLSWILVLAQIGCLYYLFQSAPWKVIRVHLQIWELSGVFLAISGILGLNWHSFSVFPEPGKKSRLIKTGIFAFIRHPIYAGIIIIIGTLVLQFWSIPRLLVSLLLFGIFILKIKMEERLLLKKFPEYSDYQNSTNRLIPFIW